MRTSASRPLLLLATLAFLLSPQSASAQVAQGLVAGDLVKTAGSSTVYEIGSDDSRLVFQMQSVYESWYGKNFAAVKVVSLETLATLPVRRVKSFKTGSVVKSPSLPTVYLVSGDLELTAIPTEKEFLALGKQFNEVRDIPDGFFTSYKIVGTLPASPVETPTSTPPVEQEPVAFDIVSRSFTATSKTAGDIRLQTTAPSTVTLSYRPIDGGALQTITRKSTTANTTHTFTLGALAPRSKYAYTITIADSEGRDRIEESGTFVTYYDLYIAAHSGAPTQGALRKENIEVGRFFIYNNSATTQHIQELWFAFETANSASDMIAKTIEIVDVTPGSVDFGSVVTFKNVAGGTSIRNGLQTQKFSFLDISVVSGGQRVFAVVLKGLENMDIDRMDGEIFTTAVEQLIVGGDAEVYTESKVIGTRVHTAQ
ncbi:MAG: hypothetical protein AAB384_00925 [Patescibacteria group bacterium]